MTIGIREAHDSSLGTRPCSFVTCLGAEVQRFSAGREERPGLQKFDFIRPVLTLMARYIDRPNAFVSSPNVPSVFTYRRLIF